MKNEKIQNVDYGIIQINKSLKDLHACRNSVYVEDAITQLNGRLTDLWAERKRLRKEEFRERNIQQRLHSLYSDLAHVTKDGKGPKSKAVQSINAKIFELLAKLA